MSMGDFYFYSSVVRLHRYNIIPAMCGPLVQKWTVFIAMVHTNHGAKHGTMGPGTYFVHGLIADGTDGIVIRRLHQESHLLYLCVDGVMYIWQIATAVLSTKGR